jgi:hypothetical protein
LATPTNINTVTVAVDGMEVGEARCRAAETVVRSSPRPEFLFFLDYDVVPQFDALTKLLYRARCFPDHDIFAGVYCCKSSPAEPLIYRGDGGGPHWDWTLGDLLTEEITGVHMGLTLIRTTLFERLAFDDERPLFKTINETVVNQSGQHVRRGTEDLYFCRRAIEEAGARILVDTSVLAGHINNATGQIFGLPNDSPPVRRAAWIATSSDKSDSHDGAETPLKRALDLGAGATRRQWPGHRTYTTDLRADVGADYVMDTRLLNLPDAHFDLVTSSHHLEHLGRWDQERVWQEIYRITKSGGRIEHIVPNLAWAAEKIADGDEDEHVMNVLYGAQETHGYRRELNTHFFGYTPAIAKALAETVGFVNVEIETFKQNAELGYNLVIRAEKPAVAEGGPDDDV